MQPHRTERTPALSCKHLYLDNLQIAMRFDWILGNVCGHQGFGPGSWRSMPDCRHGWVQDQQHQSGCAGVSAERFRHGWVEKYEKVLVSDAMIGKGNGSEKAILFIGCVKRNGRNKVAER